MFDIGFSEIVVIFVLALVVLGPEKLPRVASQVGRWIGRARGMARQFREQLEEEVNLEEARKLQPPSVPEPSPPSPPEPPPPITQVPSMAPPNTIAPTVPPPSYPDTYSHAHPTDSEGRPVPAHHASSPAPQSPTSVEPAVDPGPAIDPRQQDWVGALSSSEPSPESGASAARASDERGT